MRNYLFHKAAPAGGNAGSAARPPARAGHRPGITVAAAVMVMAAAIGLWFAGSPIVTAAPRVSLAAATAPVAPVTVPLITGDLVTVTGTGDQRPAVALRPAGGDGEAAESYQAANGDHYVIPADAVPYAGRELDRSLFDVSALARDGITATSQIPVSLTYSSGVTPFAPPGVTLTSVSGESAQGYLTARSGTRFAATLRGHIAAAVAAGDQPDVAPALDGLATMSLAAAGAPVAAQPYYPLYILQIDVTDLSGQPANTDVALMNNDDVTREFNFVPVVDGVARVAVPAGDYSAYADFFDFGPEGDLASVHAVTLNDFTVPDEPGVTTTSIDERSAASTVSVTTPRPANEDLLSLTWYRFSAAGGSVTLALIDWSGAAVPVAVNAQPAATVGRLRYVVQWGGAAPAASSGYRYDAAFGADDIPGIEQFAVNDSQIATVYEHFSADPAQDGTTGTLLNGVVDPAVEGPFFFEISGLEGTTMPGNLIDYLGTADGDRWGQSAGTPTGAFIYADVHTFAAGQSYSVQWAHGPLAPGFGQHTGPQGCLACVAGGTLTLWFNPAGDSEPDHVVYPGEWNGQFTLYRDGMQVGQGGDGAVVTGVPAVASTFRAVYDTDQSANPGVSQSVRTHTDLTVPYIPARDPGAALPAEDVCGGESAATPCRILPALTLTYRLASDEYNTSSAGPQVLRLEVGHVSYDGAGSRAPVTAAAVSVSFDGGATWQPATLTGSGGWYTATWVNPASAQGTGPELKVTAADAIGGSITQTITSAYTVAGSAG